MRRGTLADRLSKIEAAEEARYRAEVTRMEGRKGPFLEKSLKWFSMEPHSPEARAWEVLIDRMFPLYARYGSEEGFRRIDAWSEPMDQETQEENARLADEYARRLRERPVERLDEYLRGLSHLELIRSIENRVLPYFEALDAAEAE